MIQFILKLISVYFLVISIVSFVLYYIDKKNAINRTWRISEKTLLWISFLGGALGGYISMIIFRHKTKHWYFYLVNIAGIIWQFSLVTYLYLHS